jgi:hypothetical protein
VIIAITFAVHREDLIIKQSMWVGPIITNSSNRPLAQVRKAPPQRWRNCLWIAIPISIS